MEISVVKVKSHDITELQLRSKGLWNLETRDSGPTPVPPHSSWGTSKPPYSYSALICLALESLPEGKGTQHAVCEQGGNSIETFLA